MIQTKYEGGLTLRRGGGTDASLAITSQFGDIDLTTMVTSGRGATSSVVSLEPEDAEELAGALRNAAEAARHAREVKV